MPLRVAVVGLGYWGPNLVRNLQELPDVDVSTICDVDRSPLDAIGRRYPTVTRTTEFAEVLADPNIDAVAIATPVSSHHELAAAALEAQKHVFVEKPLAASSAQAADLIALSEEQGRVLMTGHTFLYSPPVNMLREIIHAGELGDVYFISTSRVNLGLHQPDVSVVWDLGPHDVSILRYWLDEAPVRVSAVSRDCVLPNVPDVAFISLEFPSGTLAHVELSWLAPSKLRRTAVVGSEKMAIYDDTSNEPVRLFDSGVALPNPTTFGEYRLTYRTGDIVSPRVDAAEPLLRELEDWVRAIREGSTPVSSLPLAVDVIRTLEAVDRSLQAGGAPVAVDGGDANHAGAGMNGRPRRELSATAD
jgi:predicted dehydrogenase